MPKWMTRQRERFQVRTRTDVLVLHCDSIESAELCAQDGRNRYVWKWSAATQRYRCVGEFQNGLKQRW